MTRIAMPDGVHLNVETAGAGPTLVLLHGFTGSAANWEECIEVFARRFQVVAVDLLGHGLSDSPPNPTRYSMESCIEDLRTLFESLQLKQIALLGYSMGGRVALSFAVRYPGYLRALILESASPGLAEPEERAARVASDEAWARRLETEGLEAFVNYWESQPLFASQAQLPAAARAAVREGRLCNNPMGLANSLRGLGTGVQPENWSRLAHLGLPCLLIAGVLDRKYAALARRMSLQIPQVQLHLVPEAGHTVHLERPADYTQAVLDFLN